MMKATDLDLLTGVSAPTIHPNGGRAVVSVTRPDLGADAYVGQLWTVPLTGHAAPKRFTRGFRDTLPKFSPDGRLIAFLRAPVKGAAQLYVVDAAGGEPVPVTDRKLGVSEFAWAPDGRQLAFVSRVPEAGRYGTVEGIDPNAEPPRHFTTLKYQSNGLGYITDRRAHVFLVAVPDVWGEPVLQPAPTAEGAAAVAPTVVEPKQLTTGEWDDSSIDFSPDGRTVTFISARHASTDDDLRSDVYALRLDGRGSEPTNLTGEYGDWSMLDAAYGLNGALYFTAQDVGPTGRDFVARNGALYVIDPDGGAPRLLTDPETVDLTESDIVAYQDDSVLVRDRSRGALRLLAVDQSGGQRELTDRSREITGAAAAGETLVVSFADAATNGDVAVVDDHGALRKLTDFSARLRTSGVLPARELIVTARDGYDIHGWVVSPEGEGPHPVLLNIHGGPFAQYSVRVFDEAQVYADAGYAVVMCNPRGSAGYGQEHGRVIRQKMGTVDLTDVLDYLEGALDANPSFDRERLGIMGGSYGGYLTAWTTSHDHRFTAAIVERGYLDPEAFIGTSDIGSFFSDEYTGTERDRMRAQSPQAHVEAVQTPTLVLHSASDLRCPLGQAERYYAALKRRGVAAELLVFPGEDHELSRSGRPRHRRERFDAILDWWARYLPSSANAR